MRNEFVRDSVLECQGCGCVLKRLTMAEAQQVARNPYNYVFYCKQCKKDVREKL